MQSCQELPIAQIGHTNKVAIDIAAIASNCHSRGMKNSCTLITSILD